MFTIKSISRMFSILPVILLILALAASGFETASAGPIRSGMAQASKSAAAPSGVAWIQANQNGFGDANNGRVMSLEVFGGQLYAGAANGAEGGQVWRSPNGSTWTAVNAPGFGDAANVYIIDMIEFNSQLYVSTGWGGGAGQIWRSPNGTDWTQIEAAGFGDAGNTAITAFAVFGSQLYAGTQSSNGLEIWRSSTGNSDSWSRVVAAGNGNANNDMATSLMEFNGYLYAAVENKTNGAEIWRTDNSGNWTAVSSGGFGSAANNRVGGFATLGGYLYVGTGNDSTGGQIWRSGNGTTWASVVGNGFGDLNNYMVESLIAYHGVLYATTDNNATGIETWSSSNGAAWAQVNTDGFGDSANTETWSGGTVVFNDTLYIGTFNDANGGEVWAFHDTSLPVSGVPVPELVVFDQTMKQFMSDRSIKAGVLVVMKNGVIVLEHGYGWKDKTYQTPLQPDALFRLASVTKPITEATIIKLIGQGKLNASDRVFCLAGSPSSCQLTITPFGAPDTRLKDITIQNLLDHKGGWDRAISGDPMFQSIAIANALGVASPPSKQDTVRYMMGRPLDYTPGTGYAYSNFGYVLLGLVIEKVSGQTYSAYIQDHIFNPLGVADTEIELGRTLPQFRNAREPWYSDPNFGPNVFNPTQTVPAPDGAWYLEAMEANGGMVATARAIAKFLQAYWISGQPRSGNGQTWWFYGSLDGTFTISYQRPDGVNLVALFNQRTDSSGLDYDSIKSLLDTATDSVIQWPGNQTLTLNSIAAQDGWVLESSEISNKGGAMNGSASTFRLGDDAAKRQYRGILSFSTGALPDNAAITAVTLKVRQQAILGGGNPAGIFRGFKVDVKTGFFGATAALQPGDFQTLASKTYGPFNTALAGGWYSINLTAGKAYVNKLSTNGGLTQIRLRFNLDDNNNAIANYLSLYSGNAPAGSRPQLVITYHAP